MRFLNAGAQQRPMALVLAATLAALAGVARAAEGDPPAPPAAQPPAAPAPVRDTAPAPGPTVLIPAPAGASDEVLRANVLIAAGHPAEARALLELRVQEHPEDIPARQILLSARVAEMEQQIRELLAEESKNPDPALDVDYQDARARADKAVVKRMEIAEYYAAERRYPDAVVTLNAILRDYPHEPAVLKLKFRLLKTMIEIERTELLKDKRTRHDDAINDVIDDARMPGELPKSKRQVFVFDEDIAAVEREALRKKLQTRLDLIFDGTGGTKPATVREVLQPLFAVAGVNYVILDSALGTETLTIHLVNETVETALATISKLVNIRYNYAAGTVFISNAASDVLITRIIRVQSGLTDVVTDPKLEDMTAGGGGGGGGGGAGGYGPQGQGQGGAANLFAQQQQQGQGANTPATSDLERFLDKVPDLVVGWPADGKIYLDRKSNTIYVRATPSAIDEVERLLYALDYNNVQVLIEARFIEVSDDAQKELGIDWAGGAANTAQTGFISAPTPGLTPPGLTDTGAVINNGAAAAGATRRPARPGAGRPQRLLQVQGDPRRAAEQGQDRHPVGAQDPHAQQRGRHHRGAPGHLVHLRIRERRLQPERRADRQRQHPEQQQHHPEQRPAGAAVHQGLRGHPPADPAVGGAQQRHRHADASRRPCAS